MNLLIDCPHCQAEVSVPANMQTPCPQCRKPVIAEDVPRVSAKRSNAVPGGFIIVLIPLGALLWFFGLFDAFGSKQSPELESRRIEYRVSGDARKAMVTMMKPDGGIEQHETFSLPWSREFTAKTGTHLSLSAQNQNSYGEVTVTILVNGIALKGSSASAAYGIAATHAAVP